MKINELGAVITGKTPSTKNRDNWGEDVCFYAPEDIAKGFLLTDAERHISNIGYDSIKNNTVTQGISILVGCIGSDMGNVALVEGKNAFNQQINAITNIISEVNPYYVYYYLSTQKDYLRQLAGSTATPILPKSDFGEINMPCFDKETQDAIVSILQPIDKLIANNNAICSDLESMAKLLYDYWFVQFDFPDVNGKPYKSSGGKMVWNEELNREIPDGWEVKMLPDVSDLQYGYPLNTDKFGERGQGVIRIRDIIDNTLSAYTTEVVSDNYLTCAGDLLVGMDGNFQMNYWIRDNDIVNQRITRIRKVDFPVMLIKMQIEPYVVSKITKVARSTVGHLGDSDFKEQPILISKGLDLMFFDTVLSQIILTRIENQQLTELRDFLLPMLMNGQVRVGKGGE